MHVCIPCQQFSAFLFVYFCLLPVIPFVLFWQVSSQSSVCVFSQTWNQLLSFVYVLLHVHSGNATSFTVIHLSLTFLFCSAHACSLFFNWWVLKRKSLFPTYLLFFHCLWNVVKLRLEVLLGWIASLLSLLYHAAIDERLCFHQTSNCMLLTMICSFILFWKEGMHFQSVFLA